MGDRLDDVRARAAILAEALPYIREFSGRTVVIKYGGHAMENAALAERFAQDVVLMHLVGIRPVVVHGGGPQITELMQRLGKEPEFVDGLRVTDAETVDIVRMALVGKVNREIVGAINQHGAFAVGLSGEDANLLRVRTRDPRLGFVGDVEAVEGEEHRVLHHFHLPEMTMNAAQRAMVRARPRSSVRMLPVVQSWVGAVARWCMGVGPFARSFPWACAYTGGSSPGATDRASGRLAGDQPGGFRSPS